MFERILAGFDGSSHAYRAVQVASVIAGRFQSKLTVVVVRPPLPSGGAEVARLEALVPMSADGRTLPALFEDFREQAMNGGARAFESVTLHGDVLSCLLGYLGQNPQDLVVVGSRGLTPGRRFLLGSISSGLVNSARCSVLVVHPASVPAEGRSLPTEGNRSGPVSSETPSR